MQNTKTEMATDLALSAGSLARSAKQITRAPQAKLDAAAKKRALAYRAPKSNPKPRREGRAS